MIDLAGLNAAVRDHGRVVRVVIAGHRGSSPREDGAAMLVWASGQAGTIGGGALEYQAAAAARRMLESGEEAMVTRHALGPELGQCCGGAVVLASAIWDEARLAGIAGPVVARRIEGAAAMPFAVHRLLSQARHGAPADQGVQLISGWLVEWLCAAPRPLWIWGAGHVGRALVDVFAPLPDFALTWIDTARHRFPDLIPGGVTPVWTDQPARLADHAPQEAWHLIVTFSHALDLDLCHRLLAQPGAGAGRGIGLIGSATKWARFRSRLAALGHPADEISRITCPIGDMSLGKHPQAIAIGVAVQLLKQQREFAVLPVRNGHGRASRKAESRDDSRRGRALAAGGSDQGLSGRHRQ